MRDRHRGQLLRLRSLCREPLALPASGNTRLRWRWLATVAEEDLVLAKLYEGHADAVAILHEARVDPPAGLGGVFAAESAGEKLDARLTGEAIALFGKKPWCSGAASVDWALVTCTDEANERRLALVNFHVPHIGVCSHGWASAGMADCDTVELEFRGARAILVGGANFYVDRPGFWHGAMGIAACWYGGARGIGRFVRESCQRRADEHALAHLGAIDAALHAAAGALVEGAARIDAHPFESSRRVALATRAVVERAVDDVLIHAGRSLGATPLCRDVAYARRVQDLAVYVRQSHAERDLASLGRACLEDGQWWF